ncbi:MAG TPA: alanine--glyoxylate aminotransferase family protein [Candidatus Acidoferrales bacterium]|nr:alanine--glyoxylate aminotransferase family protein [Candidatus Acidoferrales bacterium]
MTVITHPVSSSLKYRLRLPGPTAVPDRVQRAIAQPIVNHRGPEFRAMFSRAQELLKPVLGTSNHVFLLASSGTGAMEASLANILAPGEPVFAVVHGQFGERFASIAKVFGAQVDVLDVAWGEAVDPREIEKRVKAKEYRAVVVVYNESSTGVTANVQAIGAILRQTPTLLVVDSVSGLGGLEMKQDEWGVDIVVSSSQKCLMCPPGIGLVSVSPKAWKIVEREDRLPRYYWDFRKTLASSEKSETAFTAPVSLFAGLTEALEMIHEEGIPNVLARHKKLSTALRAGCAAIGLAPSGPKDSLSPTVVALHVPEKLNGGDIVKRLYEKHRTVIAGVRNKFAGRFIRIGTMGHVHEDDILTDLEHLEDVLPELGWPVTPGAGVAAAAAVMRSS